MEILIGYDFSFSSDWFNCHFQTFQIHKEISYACKYGDLVPALTTIERRSLMKYCSQRESP